MGLGKKGEENLTVETLLRVVALNAGFFILVLLLIYSFSDNSTLKHKTYTKDLAHVVETVQSLNGNLIYNYNVPFDVELKENSVHLLNKQLQQKIYEDFSKDKSASIKQSAMETGIISFVKQGSEIKLEQKKISQTQPIPLPEKQKLVCSKLSYSEELKNLSIVFDPEFK